MHEGVVIEAQDAINLRLCLAHRGFVERCQVTICTHAEQIERAAPTLAHIAAAQHPVHGAFLLKIELDIHLTLPQVHQIIVAAGACLAPEHPGDGIQQRGFTRAVLPGEAGKMNALEVEWIKGAVGQKILDFETYRDHEIPYCVGEQR